MTSNNHTQSPPHSHSQPLTPKQEPQIDDIATPPHNESSSFYISHKYQPPNFDFTRNRFAKSLKYQSPHSGCANKECCSPSFFLDFANVKPILSPLSSDTVPSQVGSTYTEKHLAFARTHDTPRPPISSFDTNLTGIDTSNDHKMSSPEENSVIVCKFETVEEEEEENRQEEREERKREKEVRDHPMKTRGRKRKDMEEEKLKKAVIIEKKNEKLKENRRTRRKMKDIKEMRNDDETGGYKPEEAVQVLDSFIENLNKKLSQPEMIKEEAMVEEKPADYGIEISSNNFCFESDSEEIKELLTEEESINVLKKMCKQRRPSVQFLSRLSDYREISDTVLIDETGLRQNGGKGLRFFKADERTSGRILSIPEHMDDLPTNLSKKISKLTKEESYQCRYCGKQFQKGCALGGHISRIHKGESVNFKMRQETRKKRVADRTRGKFLRKESVKQLESKEGL